jgi:adenosylcobinamide hydrolase
VKDIERVRTKYKIIGRTLVVNLGDLRRVLSSGPQGGGLIYASHILNHQVDATPQTDECLSHPARYLKTVATKLHIKERAVGLMTAVPMTQLVTARATAGRLWVECFATVGVTNAVRAGAWPPVHGEPCQSGPGTINLILVTNGSLSVSAMVGAVQVATEAKTGVLMDHAVRGRGGRSRATGTGTDVVVIACRTRGQGLWHWYSGTHTMIGAMVGRVVSSCVSHGLVKAKKWQEGH